MVDKAKFPVERPPVKLDLPVKGKTVASTDTVPPAPPATTDTYSKPTAKLDKPQPPVARSVHAGAQGYIDKIKSKGADPVVADFECIRAMNPIEMGKKIAEIVMSLGV